MNVPDTTEIILIINRCIRKFRTYVIISIFLYLIFFNDLVLSKGGGGGKGGGKGGGSKGGGGDGGGGGGGKSTGKGSIPLTSGGKPSSKWVFFYYGVGGARYCGYLCIFTAVLIPIVMLLICGCGIWRCYRIRKNTRAEIDEINKNKIENGGNDNYHNFYDEERPTQPSTSYYPPYPPPSPSPYYHPTPTYPDYPPHPPQYTPNYFNNNLDGNYTNYEPGHNNLSPPITENNYKHDLNQKKPGSRRESFDSMEEFKPKKK